LNSLIRWLDKGAGVLEKVLARLGKG